MSKEILGNDGEDPYIDDCPLCCEEHAELVWSCSPFTDEVSYICQDCADKRDAM